MTIETVSVIGYAWGKPAGVEGPEHYWQPCAGSEWRSICGMEILTAEDVFSGTPILELTAERNPIEQKRCELCLARISIYHPIPPELSGA